MYLIPVTRRKCILHYELYIAEMIMIKLFQFPTHWGIPNVSMFCMKLETYLRMTKLPFEIITVRDPRRAPKGKFPYIEDNGKKIADSGLIVSYLKEKYGDPLDGKLSLLQKSESLALQRMLEEHLYWCVFYSRWFDPLNWKITKKTFFEGLAFPFNHFLPETIRKKMYRDMRGQGMGRHKGDEIYQLGIEDLKAMLGFLESHQFLVSDVPTSVDAIGYAAIAGILYPPIASPMKDFVQANPRFEEYCKNMKERFY